jgi:hypothetical protein
MKKLAMIIPALSVLSGCYPDSLRGLRETPARFTRTSDRSTVQIADCVGRLWDKRHMKYRYIPHTDGASLAAGSWFLLDIHDTGTTREVTYWEVRKLVKDRDKVAAVESCL